jgi:hypothetical protein
LAEKEILKYCNWEINIDTPSNFIDRIYDNLYITYKNNDIVIEKIKKAKDICITLLEYAICEYPIFSSYNQIIICLSCCLIGINHINEEEKSNEGIDIQKDLKEILDKIINDINIDKEIFEECSALILKNLENDDDDNNEEDKIKKEKKEEKEKNDNLHINYQLGVTRINSSESFLEVINNHNFGKIEKDNFLKNEKNNNKILTFEIISPISLGDNISLNEELEDSLTFTNEKQFKNKLYHKQSNEEVIL